MRACAQPKLVATSPPFPIFLAGIPVPRLAKLVTPATFRWPHSEASGGTNDPASHILGALFHGIEGLGASLGKVVEKYVEPAGGGKHSATTTLTGEKESKCGMSMN